jgi:hypothetical protein
MKKTNTQGIKYSIRRMSSTQKTQACNAKKKFSNIFKKVASMIAEIDLRKTCETVIKHIK